MQINLMLSRSSKELPREIGPARAQGSSVGFPVPKCCLAVESSQAQADSVCMHSGACLGWAGLGCARGLRPLGCKIQTPGTQRGCGGCSIERLLGGDWVPYSKQLILV